MTYQPGDYNPGGNDRDPPTMTDTERIMKRRFEAGFVFEMMPEPFFPCADCANDIKHTHERTTP